MEYKYINTTQRVFAVKHVCLAHIRIQKFFIANIYIYMEKQ